MRANQLGALEYVLESLALDAPEDLRILTH